MHNPIAALLKELFPHAHKKDIAQATLDAENEDLNAAIDRLLLSTTAQQQDDTQNSILAARKRGSDSRKKRRRQATDKEVVKKRIKYNPVKERSPDDQTGPHERWESMEQLALLFPGTSPSMLLKVLLETADDLNKAAERLLQQSQQKAEREHRAMKRSSEEATSAAAPIVREESPSRDTKRLKAEKYEEEVRHDSKGYQTIYGACVLGCGCTPMRANKNAEANE